MVISNAARSTNKDTEDLESWHQVYRLATQVLGHVDNKSDAFHSILESIALAHEQWLADSLDRFVAENRKSLTLSLRQGVLLLAAQIRIDGLLNLDEIIAFIEHYNLGICAPQSHKGVPSDRS